MRALFLATALVLVGCSPAAPAAPPIESDLSAVVSESICPPPPLCPLPPIHFCPICPTPDMATPPPAPPDLAPAADMAGVCLPAGAQCTDATCCSVLFSYPPYGAAAGASCDPNDSTRSTGTCCQYASVRCDGTLKNFRMCFNCGSGINVGYGNGWNCGPCVDVTVR